MMGVKQRDDLILNPVPSILIESLRDIGYKFDTALADIIDNSLSAGANNVWVEHRIDPSPAIAIIDDGNGLSRANLLDSMRLGSRDPKRQRELSDLGRFGLGLKTASFSQCRRLTVVSICEGVTSAFCWDLDKVVASNEWKIDELENLSELPFCEMLPRRGTMVLWENLDRVFSDDVSPAQRDVVINRYLDRAAEHVSLVFHRFLRQEGRHRAVKMYLNGGAIEPLDPFVTSNSATIRGPREPMGNGVSVQSFTLPHSSKYRSPREYERNGLIGGYIKNQGIYLYRSRRLIIYGTWFGLAKKTTLTQLCRIKIDIDNSHDEEWKIDVKKASAQLPEGVRSEIRNLLERFKAPSVRVYKHRGKKQITGEVHPVWNVRTNGEQVSFEVNRGYPYIKNYMEALPADERKQFELIMRLVESGFPRDAYFYEINKSSEAVVPPKMADNDVVDIAQRFFAELKAQGDDEQHILDVMSSTRMFDQHWDEVLGALGIRKG